MRKQLLGIAILFAVSSGFPVVASVFGPDAAPGWLGVVDVVVAFALIVAGMILVSRKPGRFAADVVEAAFRAYRHLASALLLLLVLFFVTGDAIRWSILLPGLAWRGWLLVLALPSWIALWRAD